MFKFLEDCLLAWLQKRCQHPGQLCAVDILEACYDVEVGYCNRCGAVRITSGFTTRMGGPSGAWRGPDPHLWRG